MLDWLKTPVPYFCKDFLLASHHKQLNKWFRKHYIFLFLLMLFVALKEHGPVDHETVIAGAAADDQTEHKQCKFLFSSQSCLVLE